MDGFPSHMRGPPADHPRRQCVPEATINYWCLIREETRQSLTSNFSLIWKWDWMVLESTAHPLGLIVVKHNLCAHGVIVTPTQLRWDRLEMGSLKLILSTDLVQSPVKSYKCLLNLTVGMLLLKCTVCPTPHTFLMHSDCEFFGFSFALPPFLLILAPRVPNGPDTSPTLIQMLNKHV